MGCKKLLILGASAIVVSLLSSCVAEPGAQMDADDATLGDAVAAFHLSPRSSALGPGDRDGRLVLVDADGGTRYLETAGMEASNVDWSENGLVFADRERDYFLDDELISVESPKTDFQDSMWATTDGSVATYNLGFGENSYSGEVVTSSPQGAENNEVEGMYLITAKCGEDVYGVSQPTGEYAEQARAKGWDIDGQGRGFPVLMLSQLTGAEDGGEDVITMIQAPEAADGVDDAACVDGRFSYISQVYEGDETVLKVRSWDTATGEMTEQSLVTEDGEALDKELVPEYAIFRSSAGQQIQDGKLSWVTPDSQVMETDIGTGETRALFTLPDEYDSTVDVRSVTFTETTLASLISYSEKTSVMYTEVDRGTGEVKLSYELPEIAEMMERGPFEDIDSKLNTYDLAVDPTR